MELTEQRVREFADKWFKRLLADEFNGRVYLAGGAFKSVLHGRPPNDIDLFPVTEPGREQLMEALRENGAKVVAENEPYQTVLDCAGQRVEVAYSSHYPTLDARLARFDLGLSAVGVEYDDGTLRPRIHHLAQESVRRREILLIKPLINWKYALATLERMHRYARELNYEVPQSEVNAVWKVFDAQPPEMQRGMVERFHLVGNGTATIVEEATCRLHP